jgi:4a-hydroxytetrahydrobiopterin dehydratase
MNLTYDEALGRALGDLPGWERHGTGIHRTYRFDDFASATQFASRVADAAVATGRHPDIHIHDSTVTLELTPGSTGRLTVDDIALARRFQRLLGDHHRPIGRAAPWHPSGPLTGVRPRPVGQAGP